ncbi:hypothetical protein GCM10009560_20610 [Nonomuraea longicatena]|uniref:Uncharacterized protein n=2 Tax=Nonomuraea longicatena TaxID=83682 RepID=A0ABP3ZGR3_9ACTN
MVDYTGSGPYCYSNSLAMMLGAAAPPTAVIETLTGSPFGVQLVRGRTPWFDPYGWDPEIGLDDAIAALGWTCEHTTGGTPEQALARLRAADGPVLIGPVDMGLLTYLDLPAGDHYIVVLGVEGDTVLMHDPEGQPFATLPVAEFMAAWRGETVEYFSEGYGMRRAFRRVRVVDPLEALRASVPGAVRWLAGREDRRMPRGTLNGAEAVTALAALVEGGLDPKVRELMKFFSLRVGTRRAADAAVCLDLIGLTDAAAVARDLARTLGSMQYPLVKGDDRSLVEILHRLAPTYELLRKTLEA